MLIGNLAIPWILVTQKRIAQTLSSLKDIICALLFYCIQYVAGIYSFSWHFLLLAYILTLFTPIVT